jgi:hypothetical protein
MLTFSPMSLAQQYLLPATAGGPNQWSFFEPEYDNDDNVIAWHESPADPPVAPSGFDYSHTARSDEIMAAILWTTVPQLINFHEWDGQVVYLDEIFPAGVPLVDFTNISFSLNRIKGWPRFGPVCFDCDTRSRYDRYCIMK